MNAPLTALQLRTPWQRLLDGPAGEGASFHAAWMDCLVQGAGRESIAEAVLVLADGAQAGAALRPVAFWPAGRPCGSTLAALCEQALAVQTLATRQAGAGVPAMLALPITDAGGVRGVVGMAFTGAQVPREAVDWARWGLGWLAPPASPADDGAGLRQRLLLAFNLTLSVVGPATAAAAAQAFVTEAAAHLGCDRVSIGFGRGRTVRIAAMSNAADFSPRLDLPRAIEAALNEACDQGQPLATLDGRRFDPLEGAVPQPAPQDAAQLAVTREHEALGRQFGSRVVVTVPFLVDPRRYGAVCFEWAADVPDAAALQVALGLPPVAGRLLLDQRHAQRAWPRRLWDGSLAALGAIVGPRHVLAKVCVLALLAGGLWLAQASALHRVSAKAVLEGGVRRVVVAPFDGFVATASARAGEVVRAGQVLATLDDRDMRLEVERWQSQQVQYARQMQDAQAQRNVAQVQIAMAQAQQAAAQRRLSESMLRRTRVEAPFAGVLVSGDLSQNLGGAVRKGQALFEIAPLDSYRILLDVEEADIGHVAAGQKGELMVTALPGQAFPLTVKLVTPVAHASEGRNLFRVEATLDAGTERLRPGMEGIAKVGIGERNPVWIWTHRFTDWLRLQAWNWLGV